MELDFLMTSSDKVIDDMGRRSIATCTAEPLIASKTFDDAARVVDAAVSIT